MAEPRRAARALLLLLVPLASAGCARNGARALRRPSVIAILGESPVEYADFAAYVRSAAGGDPKEVSARVASSLLDQYVDELLLARAVEDARPQPEGKTAAERRRAYLAARAKLEPIPDEELMKEYRAHAEKWRQPASVRLSQLLYATREPADAAVAALAKGADWLEVSRKGSGAPNADKGGALGLLTLDDLPRDFARAVAATPAGRVTPILAAAHGFHVFRVEERFSERTVPFPEAKESIRLALLEERAGAALASALSEARAAYPVEVVEEHLPFPYVGTLAHAAASPSGTPSGAVR